MGKIYEWIGGCVFKLTQIGGGDGPGIGLERWTSANLIRGGNRDGRRAGGIKRGRYNGADYLGYYIKNNLFITDFQTGG